MEIAKTSITAFSSRIDQFNRVVQNIRDELKHQNEAVRKIPPNVDKTVRDVQKEIAACVEAVKELGAKFDIKADRDEVKAWIEPKLNSDIYFRLFPPEQPAVDTLKQMIRVHSEALSKRVIEMVKLWD